MFYYDRWLGHLKSQEFEVKLRGAADAKMDELISDKGSAHLQVDVAYLAEATETLIACRRLLKNTCFESSNLQSPDPARPAC
jgi:hypothetical protein